MASCDCPSHKPPDAFPKNLRLLRQLAVGCRATRPFRCDQKKPHTVGENEFLSMLILRGEGWHHITHRQRRGKNHNILFMAARTSVYTLKLKVKNWDQK